MNKLRLSIESCGLSFKKEMITIALINLLFIGGIVGVVFYLKKPIFIAFVIFFLIIVDYLYLSRYKTILISKNGDVGQEFISLLPFFRTYLKNNYSVYNALQELIAFSSEPLKERLSKLISDMDKDKSVTPFINFASDFKSNSVEQLMISIYQMIDEGNDSPYLIQFESIFSNLRDELYQSIIQKKDKSLANMTMLPLVGSGLLIVMITFGVIQVMGEMISGF